MPARSKATARSDERRKRLASIQKRARAASAKDRARARKIVDEIEKRLARIRQDFHAVGRLLKRLQAPKLYVALGYDNFEDLLEGEDLLSKSEAYRLIAIADSFDARTARRLGMSKAHALHAFVEATPARDLAQVLAVSDAIIGRSEKKVSEISVRELRAEARKERRRTGAAPAPTAAEKRARAAAHKIQKSLRARGARDATATARRVDNEWRVHIDLDPAHADLLTD